MGLCLLSALRRRCREIPFVELANGALPPSDAETRWDNGRSALEPVSADTEEARLAEPIVAAPDPETLLSDDILRAAVPEFFLAECSAVRSFWASMAEDSESEEPVEEMPLLPNDGGSFSSATSRMTSWTD